MFCVCWFHEWMFMCSQDGFFDFHGGFKSCSLSLMEKREGGPVLGQPLVLAWDRVHTQNFDAICIYPTIYRIYQS